MSALSEVTAAPRRYRGITAEERREQRRARLLEAGLEVFGTQGYASSSVRSICAQAALNSRYFYESFASREELLETVYRSIVAEIGTAAFEASSTAVSTEEQARTGLQVCWTILTSDRRKARVLAVEAVGVSPRLERVRRDARRAFADLLVRNALVLAREDIHLAIDPLITARALIAAFMDAVTDWLEGEIDATAEVLAEFFTRLYTVAAYAMATDGDGNPLIQVTPALNLDERAVAAARRRFADTLHEVGLALSGGAQGADRDAGSDADPDGDLHADPDGEPRG
ncbi:MAG: TetR/AcrR family transcriptional regulator [Acidobacteriota bacterium]|nr:TetR/AcrR family transcriptional regulator [Acidobacteriota bacterium]